MPESLLLFSSVLLFPNSFATGKSFGPGILNLALWMRPLGRAALPFSAAFKGLGSGILNLESWMRPPGRAVVPACGFFLLRSQEVHEPGSADRRFCGLRLFHGRWDGPRTATAAVRATPKSAEQSQNVYENKGSRLGVRQRTCCLGILGQRRELALPHSKIGGTKPECI